MSLTKLSSKRLREVPGLPGDNKDDGCGTDVDVDADVWMIDQCACVRDTRVNVPWLTLNVYFALDLSLIL